MPIIGEAKVPATVYREVIKMLCKKIFLRLRLVGLFSAVAGIGVIALDNIAAGAGLITLGIMAAFYVPWRTLGNSVKQAAPVLAGPWRYEAGDDALHVTTPVAKAEWPWKNVVRVDEHADFWLLRTAIKNQGVIVLKTAFPDDERASLAARLKQLTPAL